MEKLSNSQKHALSLIATMNCPDVRLPLHHKVFHSIVARRTLIALEKKGLVLDWKELGQYRFTRLSEKGRHAVQKLALELQNEREECEEPPITLTLTNEEVILLKHSLQDAVRYVDNALHRQNEAGLRILVAKRGRIEDLLKKVEKNQC